MRGKAIAKGRVRVRVPAINNVALVAPASIVGQVVPVAPAVTVVRVAPVVRAAIVVRVVRVEIGVRVGLVPSVQAPRWLRVPS